jgi:hypothetical protein
MLQTQLAKGVQLTTVQSHQFKTNQIIINFRAPLARRNNYPAVATIEFIRNKFS